MTQTGDELAGSSEDLWPGAWRQVPPALPERSWLWPWVAVLATAVPMWLQLDRLSHETSAVWRATSLVSVAVLITARWPRLFVPLWILTAILLVGDRRVPTAAMILLAASGASWILAVGVETEGGPRLTRLPLTARVTATGPLLVAGVLLVVGTGVERPAIATAVAGVVLASAAITPRWWRLPQRLARPADGARRFARTNARLMDRVGAPVGAALGAVVMVPAALLVVVTWCVHRLLRFDVLAPPVGTGTRWARRDGGDLDPSRAFSDVRRWDPRGPRRTAHRSATAGVTLLANASLVALLLWATVPLWPWQDDSPSPVSGPISADDECLTERRPSNPVIDDQPGSRLLSCEQRAFVARMRFDALTVYDYPDYKGRWVNVRDGARATWTPPECDCPRYRVWWFGGSAAWGWDQRDMFSLPSELAKAAWRRGVALDVENLAVPAWVLGQESRRFEDRLTRHEPPDLAIFYDGGNELNRQKERDGRGRGTDESATSWFEAELDDFMWNGPSENTAPWERQTSHRPGPRISPERIARHAMNRYQRDIERTRGVADDASTDAMFVWQPLLHSAPPAAARPGAVAPDDDVIWSRMVPAAVEILPDGVVDLSDSLDAVERPVFDDFYHTNETAARIVARQLVRPVLGRLTEPGRVDRGDEPGGGR